MHEYLCVFSVYLFMHEYTEKMNIPFSKKVEAEKIFFSLYSPLLFGVSVGDNPSCQPPVPVEPPHCAVAVGIDVDPVPLPPLGEDFVVYCGAVKTKLPGKVQPEIFDYPVHRGDNTGVAAPFEVSPKAALQIACPPDVTESPSDFQLVGQSAPVSFPCAASCVISPLRALKLSSCHFVYPPIVYRCRALSAFTPRSAPW